MILSDTDLIEHISTGEIEITPPVRREDIRPLGVRIHLAPHLMMPERGQQVDPMERKAVAYSEIEIPPAGFVLEPGQFALASSIERVRVNRSLACFIDGRSTLARLGLFVHCSSSVFDNIHDEARVPTLELLNAGPLRIALRTGMPIAMLFFAKLSSAITQASQSQYRGQLKAMPPDLTFRGGDRDEQ